MSAPHSRRQGIALVMVIMVMLIVVVIATGFTAFTTSDLRTAESQIDATTSYFLAEAGLQYGMNLLKRNLGVYPRSSDQGAGDPGTVLNLARNTILTEHVVISDLSYSSSQNWMSGHRYAGTFVVYQSVTGSQTTTCQVELISTGYIKRIPSGRDAGDSSCTKHRPIGLSVEDPNCTFRDTYDTTDEEANTTKWFIRARRSLSQVFTLDATAGNLNQSEIKVQEFKDRFR